MKEIIAFLNELNLNNNREWFEDNRLRYKQLNGQFNNFVEQLIVGISRFDPSVAGLAVKDCVYRIYRDTRFSHNKAPYKNHMAAYVCRSGKKSGFAGYYFHVEAKDAGYIGGHLLSAGIYCPQPKVLASIRDEIFDNGTAFIEAAEVATGFNLDLNAKLQRVPKGYPKDSKYAEYLKMKDFSLSKFVDDAYMTNSNLLENTLTEYEKTLSFNNLLNRAVEYAFEDN